jgi:ABC-2 type transport system permease protein
VASASRAVAPVGPIVLAQARSEFFRLIRVPAFSVPSIVFPIMFYALFGLPFSREKVDGISIAAYALASFGAYSVINVALFSFGITVANDRGEKTTVLMRATPLPPIAYLAGKVIATLAFAAIALGALLAFGAIAGGIHLPLVAWLMLGARLLVGVFPFITLGFAVGYLAGPTSAVAILQLISLPMSFASGLFMPLSVMPVWARTLAPFLPAYHFGQLAWATMGTPTESIGTSSLWLAGFTVVFVLIAIRAYYREETKTFG